MQLRLSPLGSIQMRDKFLKFQKQLVSSIRLFGGLKQGWLLVVCLNMYKNYLVTQGNNLYNKGRITDSLFTSFQNNKWYTSSVHWWFFFKSLWTHGEWNNSTDNSDLMCFDPLAFMFTDAQCCPTYDQWESLQVSSWDFLTLASFWHLA